MIDKRDQLKEDPFSYETTKKGQLRVFRSNRLVMTISEKNAVQIIKKLEHANGLNVQLILAKVTGNYKRGNER